jgi:hypothetical protein
MVMGAAVVLSLSAQVVDAERSPIGLIAAAILALGFLVMVKVALARAGKAAQAEDAELATISPRHWRSAMPLRLGWRCLPWVASHLVNSDD